MTVAAPLVTLEKVSRAFDGGAVVALREVDLRIQAGECIAIVGRSGSGKSCLVNIMSGFDVPTSGRVSFAGRPVADAASWTRLRRSEIGIVFQEFHLFPTLTAIENVEMPMLSGQCPAAERRRRAGDLLGQFGLAARLDHLPHQLSGGERQRVAIARAVVNQPTLLLADEPTGNLDSASSTTVMELLFDIQRSRAMTLVVVTHDEALAAQAQRRIKLSDGRIVEDEICAAASERRAVP
jgi:putative ABC transport system ATP-binding protein